MVLYGRGREADRQEKSVPSLGLVRTYLNESTKGKERGTYRYQFLVVVTSWRWPPFCWSSECVGISGTAIFRIRSPDGAETWWAFAHMIAIGTLIHKCTCVHAAHRTSVLLCMHLAYR